MWQPQEDPRLTKKGEVITGHTAPHRLLTIFDAARELRRISPWTLRKHIARGTLKVTRLGRRVLIRSEEIDRICAEGLPSLRCGANRKAGGRL